MLSFPHPGQVAKPLIFSPGVAGRDSSGYVVAIFLVAVHVTDMYSPNVSVFTSEEFKVFLTSHWISQITLAPYCYSHELVKKAAESRKLILLPCYISYHEPY